MADLNHIDRVMLEDLLGMGGGYVLDFSDATFRSFFDDFKVNIELPIYHKNGRSKAKRLRAFWEVAPNAEVAKVLDGLFRYIEQVKPIEAGGPVEDKHKAIVDRLLGRSSATNGQARTENEFLELEFGAIDFSKLGLSPQIEHVIKQRLSEIKDCLSNNIPLSAILLAGSTLEGLLLDLAGRNAQAFNCSKAAPKANGKVRPFHEWTLNDLINVAHETGKLGLDVKKFSHSLRDFRNYIHPFQQMHSGFSPDIHTAKISWQVLKAALADISGTR